MNKLTDFQTLKGNQFSLRYHLCIHYLQNKMHNFRFNNEISNAKICLCAQLRSIWVCIKALVGFISFILPNYMSSLSLFLCCDALCDFRVNTIFGYVTPIVFCPYFIYVFGKYLRQLVWDTMSRSDRSVFAVTPVLPPSGFSWFVICSIKLYTSVSFRPFSFH